MNFTLLLVTTDTLTVTYGINSFSLTSFRLHFTGTVVGRQFYCMHCVTFNIPEMTRIKNQFLLFAKVTFYFLGATRSIEPFSYGNVAGWVAVCHSRYCIKTTKPILKLFQPSDSPVIYAFRTPYADIKF